MLSESEQAGGGSGCGFEDVKSGSVSAPRRGFSSSQRPTDDTLTCTHARSRQVGRKDGRTGGGRPSAVNGN